MNVSDDASRTPIDRNFIIKIEEDCADAEKAREVGVPKVPAANEITLCGVERTAVALDGPSTVVVE